MIFRELYAAVPGIRKSLLGVHAKQFGERFHHMQRRNSRPSSRTSLNLSSDSVAEEFGLDAGDFHAPTLPPLTSGTELDRTSFFY
jgi:hypothetical protein